MNNISNNKNQSGFTLAEILIVITILAIMGMALLIGLNPLMQFFKGYDAVRKADLNKIKIAFEAFYADHGCYPGTNEGFSQKLKGGTYIITYTCGMTTLAPYLDKMPCDPTTKIPYVMSFPDRQDSCPGEYIVYANLSANDQGSRIPYCPKVTAAYSTNTRKIDVITGCSGAQVCYTHYGCINGACVMVSEDEEAPCGPNYCGADCEPEEGKQRCGNYDEFGRLTNECR